MTQQQRNTPTKKSKKKKIELAERFDFNIFDMSSTANVIFFYTSGFHSNQDTQRNIRHFQVGVHHRFYVQLQMEIPE